MKAIATTWVVRKVVNGGKPKLKLVRVGPKAISEGLAQLERVQVICPACGQQVEAVASDGQIRGYCAVAKQYVDFVIETQLERKKWWLDPEYRAKMSSVMKKKWQDPEYRAKQIVTHIGSYAPKHSCQVLEVGES